MATNNFGLITESWSTTSVGELWGKKWLGNDRLIDKMGACLSAARRWEAGVRFEPDDVVLEPSTYLLFKVVTGFTVPSTGTLLDFITTAATSTYLTYCTDMQRVYVLPPSSSQVIPVAEKTLYMIRGLETSTAFIDVTSFLADDGSAMTLGEDGYEEGPTRTRIVHALDNLRLRGSSATILQTDDFSLAIQGYVLSEHEAGVNREITAIRVVHLTQQWASFALVNTDTTNYQAVLINKYQLL